MKNKVMLKKDHISKVLNNPEKVREIIQEGIKLALLRHKKLGNPICVWRNNKILWIQPDDIPVK